jgi:FG-GAP-like repeat
MRHRCSQTPRFSGRVCLFPAIVAVSIVLIIPSGLASASSAPAPVFSPAVTYPSGGFVLSLKAADLNSDGIPDIVVADYDGNVHVLPGNGDGTFRNPITSRAGTCCVVSVAVADVNGDGRPDVAAALSDSNVVAILLGNGDGTFQPAMTYDSSGSGGGGSPSSVAIADLNGDGKPDLIVTNSTVFNFLSKTVDVLMNNGDGTFGPAVSYGSGGQLARSVVVGDVNKDGKLDLVVANTFLSFQDLRSAVGVLLGNGDGTFQPALSYLSGGADSASVVIGDVNGDGNPDLLATNCDAVFTSACGALGVGEGSVGVLLGNGDGTFQRAITYDLGGLTAGPLEVADLNGNKKLDVIVGSCPSTFCTPYVAVLPGNGDGTLQPALAYASGGSSASAIAVGDVNGDRKPDLLVATCTSFGCGHSGVAVLLNQTPICTTPPKVTISASPTSLWPPNGKMMPVTVFGKVTNSTPGCTTESASYKAMDEYGTVQPSGPVTLGTEGTYRLTVWLQASRMGTDINGRLYTISVGAKNHGGAMGSASVNVVVAHEKRR